jgi:hypothetical protein
MSLLIEEGPRGILLRLGELYATQLISFPDTWDGMRVTEWGIRGADRGCVASLWSALQEILRSPQQ